MQMRPKDNLSTQMATYHPLEIALVVLDEKGRAKMYKIYEENLFCLRRPTS